MKDAAQLPPFEPIEWAERLLELRERDPDLFMLRTTEATRNSLLYYKRWGDASASTTDKRAA